MKKKILSIIKINKLYCKMHMYIQKKKNNTKKKQFMKCTSRKMCLKIS